MTALTYNDVLSAYAQYPAPIRPYLLRAETHPVVRSGLTKSFLRVFIDLLARAPIADPARHIKLRVDVIASDLDVSTKTVTRTLNVLRKNGWISRAPGTDGRNNWGEFSTGEFILGSELRAMLGLPTSSPAKLAADQVPVNDADAEVLPAAAPSLLNDSSMNAVDNPRFETEMSDGLYRVNKVFKKEASFQKSGNPKNRPPRIPADLQCLHTELGINPEGICSLMTVAKANNQRLQDLWIVKGDDLLKSGATGGRAKIYIEFLLNCGEDFSYRAKQKMLSNPSPKAATGTQETVGASDHRIYWNKKFTGANGLKVRIHGDGSAEISDSQRTDAYVSPRDMVSIYEAIRVKKLWLVDE